MEKEGANEKKVGVISHYYPGIGVAVVEVNEELKVGDEIAIRGYTTDFTQKIESMEIAHKKIDVAKNGNSIGLKVKDRVREEDKVYKVRL